jgi:hypothetical protein
LHAEATTELIGRFGDPQTIVEQARAHAVRYAPRYADFQAAWKELMNRIEQDTSLRQELADAIPGS